jgi:NPCBM/NEW2 domain
MNYRRNVERAFSNLQFAIILFLLILSLLSSQFVFADAPVAVPIEGRPFSGQLISIDAKGQITFQTAGQKHQLPLADLVAWGACPEPKRTPILVLADGGLLAADVLSSDKEILLADSDLFGRLKIPWDRLAGMVFRLPPTTKDRDALLDRIARADDESDRLLLDNGDELAGLLEKIEEDAVKLKTNVGVVDVELGRVTAIVFNPGLRRKISSDTARTWLGFSDGSRLLATGLRMDSSNLQFSVFGQTWTTACKHLVFVQPMSGRVAYLSDLKPGEYRFVPFLELTWPYRLDRGVTGTWLRAGGILYLKGIGLHSAARLAYNLDQPYKRFQAELAIDDSASGGGSVRFRVFVDGQEKFTSDTIRGGMKPVPIRVDLTGAKQLDLVVDYADRADVLDHSDWLNARLVK